MAVVALQHDGARGSFVFEGRGSRGTGHLDVLMHWLAIVDSAGWPASYTEASQLFKSVVSPEVWIRQIRAARTPLGPFVSRSLAGSQYATSLPGAPDGEYVVLTYSATFENKESAVETITPMKDTDDAWRVSGYYVK